MVQVSVVDRLDADERAEAEAVIETSTSHDRHPALADAVRLEVEGLVPPSGFTALARDDGGAAVAIAPAVRPNRDETSTWSIQTVVVPEVRRTGVDAELTRRAVDEAWARGARRVQWWAFRADDRDDALAAELGLERWRDLLQMRRPLPHPDAPTFPSGVRVRSFEPGRDEAAWLRVNGRAFAAHPEQGAVTLDDLRGRIAEPWFEPADFLLAEEGDVLIGFCWTKIPGDGTGEIYVIGTDPDHRGRGLGRALVLAGLTHMTERGATTATLYVDRSNEPAVELYRSLGFEVDHIDRAYAADR